MTQSKEAKALGYASPAAMIRVFQGFMLLQLSFCIMYAKDTAAPFEIMLATVSLHLSDCWEDIKLAGLNGGCVYSWQDDWSKRTWNTYYAINEERSLYWSDYQTNGQYFGLLSFDPGEKESVCYVDGDISEWKEDDILIKKDIELSVKYDEKFMYFLVKKVKTCLQESLLLRIA